MISKINKNNQLINIFIKIQNKFLKNIKIMKLDNKANHFQYKLYKLKEI